MHRLTLLLLLLLHSPLAICASAQQPTVMKIATATIWSGVVDVSQAVQVQPGAELTLAPGTRITFAPGTDIHVQGSIKAVGTAVQPILLSGKGDSETPLLTIADAAARATVAHAEIRGAKSGLVVRGGAIHLSQVRVTQCGTGIGLELKGRAELTDVRFDANELALSVQNNSSLQASGLTFHGNRVGVGAGNGAKLRMQDSAFSDNDVGYGQRNPCDAILERCGWADNRDAMVLRQTRRSPRISFATFTDNGRAIVARLFAHVFVEASTFRANTTAVDAVNFCGPFLRYNDFVENGQAIRLDKKCSARIENNRLEQNEVALFADFSSYPRVFGNLFRHNQWHVRLGIYQSADWERQQGSGKLTLDTAQRFGSRNPLMLRGELPSPEGLFSVADNAWDDETAAEIAAAEIAGGEQANISRFWDGLDQEAVSYEGFGEELYQVDVIRFLPTRTPAAVAVGPAAWTPLPDAAPTAPPPQLRRPETTQPPSPPAPKKE